MTTAAPPRWVPRMPTRPVAPPRSVSRLWQARARPGPMSGPLQEVRTQPRSPPAAAPVVARSAASVWPLARVLTPARAAAAPQPEAAAARSQPPPGPLPRAQVVVAVVAALRRPQAPPQVQARPGWRQSYRAG